MKKISVIIPVYNVEKYLYKCVDSVINQTYKNLEIILVDDGSPDNSSKICDDYAKMDERIKVVHKTNGGLSSARNSGLMVATGDYICFFDSDDFVELDIIEKLTGRIEQSEEDVCVCGYKVEVYNKKEQVESSLEVIPRWEINDKLSAHKYEQLLGVCGYAWNKLYKREFLAVNGLFFEEGVSLIEDLLFNSTVISKGAKVCFVSYAGYHYIQRQRETLGVKYYNNFFELRKKAIEAKCAILKAWGVDEEKIEKFTQENFIDIVWGTIKNLKRSGLSLKEKKEKIKILYQQENIKKMLKNFKPHDKKRRIKRLLLKSLCGSLLLKIVK